MVNLTPMFKQFFDTKAQCPGCILLFRVGDFYETYGEDAEIAAKELGITLTSKDNQGDRMPMAGVPYHSVEPYLYKLIRKGYKVAICEQVEDPKKAKGLVKREIVRIVTSGTLLENKLLEDKQNNYLISVSISDKGQAIAIADISTGEFNVTFIADKAIDGLKAEIARLKPAECILLEKDIENNELQKFLRDLSISVSLKSEDCFSYQMCRDKLISYFGKNTLNTNPFNNSEEVVSAAGAIINYLEETQRTILKSITKIGTYRIFDYMFLDHRTRRNLELTSNIRDGKTYGTLLWVIDKTKTSMGGRKLTQWIEQPLMKISEIRARLDSVEELYRSFSRREHLREALKSVKDLERLVMRISYGSANGRDLVALKNSLEILPVIKDILSGVEAELLKKLGEQIKNLEEIKLLIEKSIDNEPPFSLREGNIIKSGFNSEVDELRNHRYDGKAWITELEKKEREKTGIKSLKVKYNKVFGYFIEVTMSNAHLVPEEYIRKQTLTSAERFITPELKEHEVKVLGAAERLKELEYELFSRIREEITSFSSDILLTADAIATLDVLASLAEVAVVNNYIKPEINKSNKIYLKGSRHPVIEEILGANDFVPNEAYLDCSEDRLLIVTGPNMAGKSTYLRQVALCVIMAQIGSFIPAVEAGIGLVDRVFTRIGAYDDLVMGQSTFLVEMKEVADILKNATGKSLLILDEIGRGTSTYDGLSIAWAVAEYIYENIKCKTLFTTHFHELTQMADYFPGIRNYRVAVNEKGDDIVFLRKIFPGGTDRSYGVKVASLAGLPVKLLQRAQNILEGMEKGETIINDKNRVVSSQMEFFQALPNPLIDEIRYIDIDKMTPVDALLKISELKNRIEKQYV